MKKIDAMNVSDSDVTCATCQANCCRLEVMLITDTGVPEKYVELDQWGGMTMARLDDGWCAALDRPTMLCSIYEHRPLICREFEMGGYDCLAERASLPQVRTSPEVVENTPTPEDHGM